ncbi:Do family serine endopeptidase [Segatella salivae]|jgi:peptidase Do|uniref:Do family serine endopeptidase n=1 Tax=Segatella salivae TaxID=228604 RepID=A0AAW4NP49_9BACT|nr:Do family serine endopeptidase [Segatella salivae]MBF1527395.1 Do family serine endopeptidase [Segatella salivae]MBF1529519.1 Do family serine endopeptidase [Segatella salivae]MBF1530857.1 Do family serine endopeptidase [Segatella salivae]MBF1537329.1 Do family serine endopeptidase [Segatella salivae]MBF1553264.1 Do family serine endopeptidase [Segatella salivae]
MKMFSKYVLGAMCVGAFALSTGAFIKVNASPAIEAVPSGQPIDLTYAAEKALPAVVHIKYVQNSKVQTVDVQEDPFSDFFGPFGFFGNPDQGNGRQKRRVQTPKKEATGSGVIISPDGYIVTNNHVVNGADELTVTLNDNREYSARIIGTDPNTDLALIKVNGKNLPTLPIGDSDNLKVGEWVLAVGNPYNLSSTVTAGIVSAKARSMGGEGSNGPQISSFIQTDAAINPGNSGGALVNAKGELVGINAMLYSQTGSYSGYGFAIPTTIMVKVVDDLKKYGTVQRAVLGIRGGDVLNYINAQKDEKKDVDLGTNEGVYVAEVTEGSSAAAAGIVKGDVITEADGKKITKMSELQELLSKKRPGEKVTLTYLHNKSKHSKTVTLKNAQGNTKVIKTADLDVLGASFRPVTEQQKKEFDLTFGLEVTKVEKGAIKSGGIEQGFIMLYANDTPLKSLSDLQELVKSASTSQDPVLIIKGIWPSGKRDYKVVKVSE